ncbi:MAG: GNAT family N-acetyltransferase [Parvibaculum sp.]
MQIDEDFYWRVEQACWDAWPAAETRTIDGWQCRASGGATRRVNSVNATASAAPLKDVLPGADAYFEKRGGPALFRLLSFQPAFAHALAARGYQAEGETSTLLAMLDDERSVRGPVELTEAPTLDWLSEKANLSAQAGPEAEIYRAMLGRITGPACFARKIVEGRGAALAYAAFVDPFIVIESVLTAEAYRGQGLGHETVAALMNWGRAEGARFACLQVEAHNRPALALYKKLGFGVTLYNYQYWRKQVEPGHAMPSRARAVRT